MKKPFLLFSFLIIILTACTQDKQTTDEQPELLEVSIHTPETIDMNQEIAIEASVTQGKEKVTDADEVKFEIWKSGEDEHEMVEGKHDKDGVYSIKKTFREGGTYNIVAHVTARRMHNMPKKEIVVTDAEEENSDTSASHDHEGNSSEHAQDEHHSSAVDFEFHAHDQLKSNEKSDLTVHINQESAPVTGATVKFEIWAENESKHAFIEAVEGSNGAYTSSYTFPDPGKYDLKIHVEKGNIHDHTEETVEVK
jgi:hypothetical protein